MKLTARVIIVAVVPLVVMLVVTLYQLNSFSRIDRATQEREDLAQRELLEERLLRIMEDLRSAAAILAGAREAVGAVEAADVATLVDWGRLFHGRRIQKVVFTDMEGIVLARSDRPYEFSDSVANLQPFAAALAGGVADGFFEIDGEISLAHARTVRRYGEIPVGTVVTAMPVSEDLLGDVLEGTDLALDFQWADRTITTHQESRSGVRARLPIQFRFSDGRSPPNRASIVYYRAVGADDLTLLQSRLVAVVVGLLVFLGLLLSWILHRYLKPYGTLVRELLGLAAGRFPMSEVGSRFAATFRDPRHEVTIIASAVARLTDTIDENMRMLEELSTTDQLTSLPNRRRAESVLAAELSRSSRYDTPFAVLLLDVDHFKAINDLRGHEAGDAVLREIAALVRENCRRTDLVARWGGEEFLVICPHLDLDAVVPMAEKIRLAALGRIEADAADEASGAATAAPAPAGTLSIGVAVRQAGDTRDTMLHRADTALYAAKSRGRNRVVVG